MSAAATDPVERRTRGIAAAFAPIRAASIEENSA